MKKKLILLDGNSLFNRAFFALPPLMNKKGFYTNAIYGFATMTNNIIENQKPDYMAVAFDLKGPTFRHKEFEDYKAGRKKMPDELRMQVEPLKEMVEAMGIARAEFEGYEADDIIGTLSKFGEEKDLEVVIVTGDKDALQLASPSTTVLITKKGISEVEPYTDETVYQHYGLTPLEFIDLKALMGDKSDNIKGVEGIGEKTGMKLLHEYRSIEKIYENIDSIKGTVKSNLEKGRESAFLSKKLATIIRNMPLEVHLEELIYQGPYIEKLSEMYREFEFTQLLNKLMREQVSQSLGEDDSVRKDHFALNPTEEINFAKEEFDPLTIEPLNQEVILAADMEKQTASCEYILHRVYLYINQQLYVVAENKVKELKSLLENKGTQVVGHDLKTLYKAFMSYGIDIQNLSFDVELAEYVIDSNSGKYDLESINNKYGLSSYEGLESILGKGKNKITSLMADEQRIHQYYKNTIQTIHNVHPIMKKEIIDEELEYVYYDMEMKLIKVLAKMEMEGFSVDQQLLSSLSVEFSKEISRLEEEIHQYAGEAFNISSPKQLGVILFEKLQLPTLKKTKTGYSTNAEVLEFLQEKHPIIPLIMDYRQITKLKSTYIDGISNILDRKTGKVYTTFSQTTASTGRLSSLDPNLQNIPIRTERGRKLRGLFIAEDGYDLVDADYSQIELRILAHLANDPDMIQAFADDVDIHTRTASEVFGVPIDQVTSELRGAAKAVNFGIVYGISDFGLSNNLGISMAKAKEYINQYLKKYEDVNRYLKDVVTEVEESGYSKTIFGRKRNIPELKAKNAMVRGFGKRLAMNTPIQGSAADIIKIAMIEIDEYLSKNYPDAKLLLQVHDELIIQAKEKDSKKIETEIKEIMEHAAKLQVHLKVEAKRGKNWFDTK